jgi:uncharacterized protein (DUF952 family)
MHFPAFEDFSHLKDQWLYMRSFTQSLFGLSTIMAQPIVYHITTMESYQEALPSGSYTTPSLATEGFIHMSTDKQTPKTLERWFVGKTGLVLLQIDLAKLTSELKFEKVYDTEDPFPHLYGPLNTDAVVKILPVDD